MKIELHNLLRVSLWEEEYTSVIVRGKSLIIINREGKPKTIKFPFNLRHLLNIESNADTQNKAHEKPHHTANTF